MRGLELAERLLETVLGAHRTRPEPGVVEPNTSPRVVPDHLFDPLGGELVRRHGIDEFQVSIGALDTAADDLALAASITGTQA